MDPLRGVQGDYGLICEIEDDSDSKLFLVFRRKDGAQFSLRRSELYRDDLRLSLLAEADTLKKIMHRNLVRLEDIWISEMRDRKICNILMELCEVDLATIHSRAVAAMSVTNENPLLRKDEGRLHTVLEDYCQQMLEGLSYLHSLGHAHSDLRLSNIFVKEQYGRPAVKLGDPGLAKRIRYAPRAPFPPELSTAEAICGEQAAVLHLVHTITSVIEG